MEQRQEGIDQMDTFMKKMRRNKIDLIQVHNLIDWQTHLKTLRKWKEEGKIRYIGVTHYTDSAHNKLKQIVKSERLDFVQFNYSISIQEKYRYRRRSSFNKKISG